MSGVHLSKESTPKERLEKYKKDLVKLAEEENSSVSQGARTEKVKKTTLAPPKSTKPKKKMTAPGPPRQLVSPSKLELREARTIISKTKKPLPRRRSKAKDQNEIVRLRIRSKSFQSKWTNVKIKRNRLEKKYERGFVGEKEYKKLLTSLVNEGHELLQKKAKVDREIRALESR